MNAPRWTARKLILLSPLLSWIVVATPGLAAVNRWSSNGPTGAVINCLAVDPGNPRVLYAGGDRNGVFKSLDGGLSWNATPGFSANDSVSALAIDPLSPSIVYAAGSAGVLRSLDAGESWTKSLQPGARGPIPISLAINPAHPSIVYAGTQSRSFPASSPLYQSTDRGATWNVAFIDEATEIASLLLDSRKPSTVYEADYDYADFDYVGSSKVYTSTNDGASWRQAGGIPAGVARGALVIDPADASILYAGTYQGFYKSTDAGTTWTQTGPELKDEAVTALAIDPRHPGILYAGTAASGILRSVDGGASWSPFNAGLSNTRVLDLAIDRTGTRLHAGTSAGVFDYQILLGPLDLSVGTSGEIDLLSAESDGGVLFQSFDGSGHSSTLGPFGPYSGWTPSSVASTADGLTRVLWNNVDGSAGLSLTDPRGNVISLRLGVLPGFAATDLAVSVAGLTHVLWTGLDGRVSIWSVGNSGPVVEGPTYGPYAGWYAVAAADGSDGLTRVLWNHLDGRSAISLARDGTFLSSYGYGPVAGWTALDIAAGGDGLTRILWSHQDGRIALWIIDSQGNVTIRGPVYAAPTGMRAGRIAAGQDGSVRVLFTDGQGGALLWFLSPAGAFQSALDPSHPNPAGISIGGTWTGTFSSDNIEFCTFSGIPARATFVQDGSAVRGTLDAPTAPCLALQSRAFIGTLVGNRLSGSDGGFGSIAGTVSDTTLEIDLGLNPYGFASEGQLHLHR